MENAKLQTNNVLEKKKTGSIDANGQSTNIKSENCIRFKQNKKVCLPTNEEQLCFDLDSDSTWIALDFPSLSPLLVITYSAIADDVGRVYHRLLGKKA